MTSFKLLTYAGETGPVAGVLVGDRVLDASSLLGGGAVRDSRSTLGILADWDRALPLLRAAAAAPPAGGQPLSDVHLLAPILYPGAYFCIAANYYKHSREMNPDKLVTREGREPYFFLKPPRHTTVGPGDAIRIPEVTQKFDWEVELAVVIGREARNLSVDEAFSCIAGYTIVNDLSARDLSKRTDWIFFSDWFGQKVFDAGMPMGPWITPAENFPDPQNVPLRLWVNDEIQQDSTTADMIFTIAEQIEYVTRRITLYPGDVIATGTPAGAGGPRGLFLKSGDAIRMEIPGIGSMTNSIL